ncbi:GNAT family N-acetyltransferase [Inediibacterium massiliense]|uniref:GNAT family N-acetyltransferase n=1 Tax=Inediibacterium massiliense TaxID=1658111 RepID=UPI0006B5F664|nr:GNAT family N-acetyltransferase [Inediibacterium massiliense]
MVENIWLETERLIIRSYTIEDVTGLYETLNDSEVLKYIPEGQINIEQANEAIRWLMSNYKIGINSDFKYSFPIILKERKAYIGWCGIGYLDYDNSKTEIYYTLKSKYWGKGYATEAMKAIVNFTFKELKIRELVAVVKPENIDSIKVIEKLGFKYKYILRNVPIGFEFYEGELFYLLKKDEYMKETE